MHIHTSLVGVHTLCAGCVDLVWKGGHFVRLVLLWLYFLGECVRHKNYFYGEGRKEGDSRFIIFLRAREMWV